MNAKYQNGIAFTDNAYWPVEEAKISLLDWGFLRSDANQDTISVWNGMFFRLEDHLDRFERNLQKLRFKCPYTREEQHSIAAECVRQTGFLDAYVQILMTRGRPPIGVRDSRQCLNKFHVFCLPYMWLAPAPARKRGLHMKISHIQRVPPETVDSTIKHYHWLDFQVGLFDAYDAGADTVILIDRNGNVTEGPGFNMFIVKNGQLGTPVTGVLDGITRRTVMELCDEADLECILRDISPSEVFEADEVFVSSTAGGIIAVTMVDKRGIGNGKPGVITNQLNASYWTKREAGWRSTRIDYD